MTGVTLTDDDGMDTTHFERLGRQECLRLLDTVSVGRVVFTSGALPAVEPVRFVRDDDHIVVRAWHGPKLVMAQDGTVVAFQADALDDTFRVAWSVTVVGTAHLVDDTITIDLGLVTGRRARTASTV